MWQISALVSSHTSGMPLGDTKGCQPGTEKSHGGLGEAIHPMCGGEKSSEQKSLQALRSAFPDGTALFSCLGSWCDNPHIKT